MSNTEQGYTIFCDGACSGNPGPGGWGAILITPEGTVAELGGFDPQTTNNKMEITAAIEALSRIPKNDAPIVVYTDSSYLINGITKWIFGWRNKGWKTSTGEAVANQPLWERLSSVTTSLGAKRIRWQYVPGHQGVVGNDRADAIAVAFSTGEYIPLYRGSFDEYLHDVLPVIVPEKSASSSKRRSSTKGYYLSWVNNVLERHETWKECEAKVKGRANAKFKKITSAAEEASVLKLWGATK